MKTFEESLAEFMENPGFRTEWEALEPMREIMRTIIEGKPLTGYTLEQIADAADVSIEEAAVIQKSRQTRAIRPGTRQARATIH